MQQNWKYVCAKTRFWWREFENGKNWWQNHISFEFPDRIIILTFFSRHVGLPRDWLQKFQKIRNAWVQSSQRFFVGNIFHAALNEMKILGDTHNKNTRQKPFVRANSENFECRCKHLCLCFRFWALSLSRNRIVFFSLPFLLLSQFVSGARAASTDIASEVMPYGRDRSVIACFYAARLCTSPLPSSGCRWLYATKCDGACLSLTLWETNESFIVLDFFFVFLKLEPRYGHNRAGSWKSTKKNVNNAYDAQSHSFCLFSIVDKCRWSMVAVSVRIMSRTLLCLLKFNEVDDAFTLFSSTFPLLVAALAARRRWYELCDISNRKPKQKHSILIDLSKYLTFHPYPP